MNKCSKFSGCALGTATAIPGQTTTAPLPVAGGRRRGPKGLFVEFDSWLSDDSTAFHGFLEFGVGEEGLRLLY